MRTLEKFVTNLEDFHITKNNKICIAVSGGPDSMAMLLLFHEANYNIIALTVDHGLRSESFEEAVFVENFCRSLGICHVILKIENITKNILGDARQKRYEKIANFCKENGICNVAIGHQSNDIVENFFISLNRGCGILGLTSGKEIFFADIRFFRPIHNFSKKECKDFLVNKNVSWIEDPSNNNNKFLRSKVRDKVLSDEKYLKSIRNLESDFEYLRSDFIKHLSMKMHASDYGFISLENLDEFPVIFKTWTLQLVLELIGNLGFYPRGSSIKEVYKKMPSKSTLHKCVIENIGAKTYIYSERSGACAHLKPKSEILFERRFLFFNSSDVDFIVRFPNDLEASAIRSFTDLPFNILRAIPVLEHKSNVLMPLVGYYGDQVLFKDKISCRIKTFFYSRLVH